MTWCLLANYTPFIDPMPIHDWWFWLLVPLCLLFSIVYKAVKCESVRQVPREALSITLVILVGMAAAAVVLTVVVKVQERDGRIPSSNATETAK
jgi:hypothetical protein